MRKLAEMTLAGANRTALRTMSDLGTSPWIDNITREWFTSGKLAELIDNGVVGLTSNPTIFASAVASTPLYDEQIRALSNRGLAPSAIALELAKSDIGQAARLLDPVYAATNHKDGWASIEVDPDLAFLATETFVAAKSLHTDIGAPNVMVKIPATDQGLGPIEETIAMGIPVNVTLIFSIDRYREVYQAFLRGAARFVNSGGDPRTLGSVASFFVSRIDSALDVLLSASGRADLIGKAAIAQAKLAYEAFLEISATAAAQELFAAGLRPQRPLFASTSTKNPAYPKLMYVENLIGPDSVNTMPLATLEEMLRTGRPVASTVTRGLEEAKELMLNTLGELGISMAKVTADLEAEGLKSFSTAWHNLGQEISKKIANS